MDILQSGVIEFNQSGSVQFTPQEDAIYLLGVSAGECSYSITRSNAPLGILTGDGASFIGEAKPLCFFVPENIETFTISARGGGGVETFASTSSDRTLPAATGQPRRGITRCSK